MLHKIYLRIYFIKTKNIYKDLYKVLIYNLNI